MTNNYCTDVEIKQVMPDSGLASSYDALLNALAERASREIDRLTGRAPGAYKATTDETRYVDGSGEAQQWIGELAAAPTTVKVAEGGIVDAADGTGGTYTTWAASDYLLWPSNALAEGGPILRLDINRMISGKAWWAPYPKAVKITGKFGYSSEPPPDVVEATIVLAVRWFKRGQQGFADTGAIAELRQLRYVKALDPDVEELVHHLRRVAL